MMNSKKRFVVLIALFLVMAVSLFAGAQKEAKGGKNDLVIHHWWTAGGEKQAIDAVLVGFQKKYPEVRVIQNPVAGGGGQVMQAQIKTMIMAGQAPDTFQVLLGTGQLAQWVDALEPIDDIWQGFNAGPTIKAMVTKDGHQYGVPINIHTSSIIWFNNEVVKELGIKIPLASLDETYQVCEKAKRAGYNPIAFGAAASQKVWWIHLAQTLLAMVPGGGADYIEKVYAGTANPATDPQIPALLQALKTIFQKGYTNSDYSALTWDQAGNVLMAKKALMFEMGDWTKGLFTSSGWKPKVDFDYQLSGGIQAFHGDFFSLSKNAPHKESVRKWLKYVTTSEAQTLFNPIKGSIPALLDAPMDAYDVISKELFVNYKDPSKKKIQDSDAAPPVGNNEAFGDFYSIYATNPDVAKGVQDFTQAYNKVFGK
jgi:glucose/mannose transport system substrate-binding protein